MSLAVDCRACTGGGSRSTMRTCRDPVISQRSSQMKIATAIVPASMLAAAALFVLAPVELTQAQGPGARPDLDAIKRDYRRPAPRPVENPLLVALGRALFFDPRISASSKTACASCHFPELGYVVTAPPPLTDSLKPTSPNSTPLT